MGLGRIRSVIARLPCTCSFSSRPQPFASPFASTSASTLDDPIPEWQDLAPATLRALGKPVTAAGAQGKAAQPRSASHDPTTPARGAKRPRSLLPPSLGDAPPPQLNRAKLRRPPNERTQVSPYLPLFTRERNFLLSHLRQALSSRAVSRRHRRNKRRVIRSPWNPDAVWYALARVLRYPDDLPPLPPSHFPSSTRAASPPSYPHEVNDPASGYFTATRIEDGSGHVPASATGEAADASGRRKIALTMPELRRAFAVFASARPRTRNGLHRLLVVAELIAQKVPKPSTAVPAGDHGGAEVGAGTLEHLRGGGAGLRDKDWRALLLFVGASMRASRAAHEVKHTLDLFSYWLKLRRASGTGDRPTSGRQRPGRPGGEVHRSDAQRMYNAVLFVAGRARMWELFEQVLRRMGDECIRPDYATVVELIRKEDQRGAPAASAWRIFEDALATRRDDAEEGEVDALWAAMAWVLARRGLLNDAMRLYEAMQAGQPVSLDSLRPSQELDPHSPGVRPPSTDAPHVVQPPALNDRIYSALLKAFAYRGDLAGALRILRDLSRSPSGDVSPGVHHFIPLFHAFAHHGQAPFSTSSGGRVYDVNLTRLAGSHLRAHAMRRDASPLTALSRMRTSAPRKEHQAGAETSMFTLEALETILATFLALPAPLSSSHGGLPFVGARTAPSSKDLWWILFAYDKLSGGDSELVLAVYEALERKFTDEKAGWTGWRDDKRTPKLVKLHRDRAEERRRKCEELQ